MPVRGRSNIESAAAGPAESGDGAESSDLHDPATAGALDWISNTCSLDLLWWGPGPT
jgi:hypothetical protein